MSKKKFTPRFTLSEFENVSDTFTPIIYERCFLIIQYLSHLREKLNAPIRITSYYRNSYHNKCVGGVPTSLHTKGFAVDFQTDAYQNDVIRELKNLPYCEIIVYDNFYHYAIPNPYKTVQTILDKRK